MSAQGLDQICNNIRTRLTDCADRLYGTARGNGSRMPIRSM
jgi:hypothetical protein